ncbi:hypothetical protein HJD18_01600 [Thermoleophilia bacterium SCSIO 60948]|nr:hypothetical protein HJD18_01600 [Thermoleophilia bacterium SCSIO 60948]
MPTSSQRLVGAVLIAAGAAFLIAGLALGTAVDPIWASLIAVGGCDIIFGAMFMTGRLGGTVERGSDGAVDEAGGAAAPWTEPIDADDRAASPYEPDQRAGTDPDYNPYVRGD